MEGEFVRRVDEDQSGILMTHLHQTMTNVPPFILGTHDTMNCSLELPSGKFTTEQTRETVALQAEGKDMMFQAKMDAIIRAAQMEASNNQQKADPLEPFGTGTQERKLQKALDQLASMKADMRAFMDGALKACGEALLELKKVDEALLELKKIDDEERMKNK
jgi:predicted membrane-bound mannosyltransferase